MSLVKFAAPAAFNAPPPLNCFTIDSKDQTYIVPLHLLAMKCTFGVCKFSSPTDATVINSKREQKLFCMQVNNRIFSRGCLHMQATKSSGRTFARMLYKPSTIKTGPIKPGVIAHVDNSLGGVFIADCIPFRLRGPTTERH